VGRNFESAEDWKMAIEYSADPQLADLHRLQEAEVRALVGQYREAEDLIEDWNTRSTPQTPPDHLRHCASVYGLAIQALANDASLSHEARDQSVRRYMGRAIDFLERTRAALGADKWKQAAAGIRNEAPFKTLMEQPAFRSWIEQDLGEGRAP
jgi:hypothetical protein